MTTSTTTKKSFWGSRSPIFRFLIGFGVCMALFYLFYYSNFYQQNLSDPIEHFQARLASKVLNVFGYGTQVQNDSITGSEFSVHIAKGCDGLEPLAMLVFAILMFPILFKYKWRGLVAGILSLFVLNIFRIAGLYLVGIYIPSAFDFLHLHGGFVIFTVLTIVIWMLWANWAMGRMRAEKVTA